MSDLIDRQAAIDDIWTVSPLAPLDREWIDRWLRQFPPAPPANTSEIPNSSDTISRQAAIDATWEEPSYTDPLNVLTEVRDRIEALPPAQPDRIRGRWVSADAIFGGEPFYCSECGENTRDTVMGKPRWNFCPNCGAKMEVTE